MKKISYAIDVVMANYLTDEKKVFNSDNIFKSGSNELFESKKLYGTMMLHPILKCTEECLTDEQKLYTKNGLLPDSTPEDRNALSNTVMSATTASAYLDYDTAYGSRGYLTKEFGNYCWINDFILQTLMDNNLAYVEMSNSIKKVSHSMFRNEENEKKLAMENDDPFFFMKEEHYLNKKKSCTRCCDPIIGANGEPEDYDLKACKGCEFTLFNGKTRISMYDHVPVTQKQNFVNTKWLMMVCCDTSARFDNLPTTAFIFFHLDLDNNFFIFYFFSFLIYI